MQNLDLNTDLHNETISRLGYIKYALNDSCAFYSCLRFDDELWPSLSEGASWFCTTVTKLMILHNVTLM